MLSILKSNSFIIYVFYFFSWTAIEVNEDNFDSLLAYDDLFLDYFNAFLQYPVSHGYKFLLFLCFVHFLFSFFNFTFFSSSSTAPHNPFNFVILFLIFIVVPVLLFFLLFLSISISFFFLLLLFSSSSSSFFFFLFFFFVLLLPLHLLTFFTYYCICNFTKVSQNQIWIC